MGMCKLCKKESNHISDFIGVCLECIRKRPDEALSIAKKAHSLSRARFGLVGEVPKGEGIQCGSCGNMCVIPEGGKGYCGLVRNDGGKLIRDNELIATFYYDPLPTNCVGAWACAATGVGYPKYSHSKGQERGYSNLAVFCVGCSLDCLFCQNWRFREDVSKKDILKVSDERFLDAISEKVSCICFFGGDPSPQLDKIARICKKAREEKEQKILRFCLETNGNANPRFLRQFADVSLPSGGCVKFDLKFWNEALNRVLCGISNKKTIENFKMLGELHKTRKEVPFLTASTLMIPGYIDDEEIRGIASFIASVDESIPYSLLAFYPHFEMRDLPLVKGKDALRYKEIAGKEGLKNVRIGNIHLLV